MLTLKCPLGTKTSRIDFWILFDSFNWIRIWGSVIDLSILVFLLDWPLEGMGGFRPATRGQSPCPTIRGDLIGITNCYRYPQWFRDGILAWCSTAVLLFKLKSNFWNFNFFSVILETFLMWPKIENKISSRTISRLAAVKSAGNKVIAVTPDWF